MNPDIVVDLRHARTCRDRLYVSAGTRFVAPRNQLDYQNSAVLPKPPWTLTSANALAVPDSSDAEDSYHRTIRIVDFENHEEIRNIAVDSLRNLKSQEEVERLPKSEFSAATDCFLKAIEGFKFRDRTDLNGVTVNQPGLETTTRNRRTGKRVGLHIDSWEGAKLEHRDTCSNRISLNLSAQDRWFLFSAISAKRLHEHLRQRVIPEIDFRAALLPTMVPMFVTDLYPDWPVYRVKVRPLEAYIAPTENLIHDGSSVGNSGVDISMTVRGFFGADPHLKANPA